MPEFGQSGRCRTLLLAALAGSLFVATPAYAHKLNVFAYAEGSTIRGEVYARGGETVHEAAVTIYGPDGAKLGETKTDHDGKFALEASFRCDHRIVVDGGGGHLAEFTLAGGELPESLPPKSTRAEPPETPVAALELPKSAPSSDLPVDQEQLLAQLASLERQIVQLRKQLDGYEAKVRWHDVLGGLGYILGLMGLAYYFLGRKKA